MQHAKQSEQVEARDLPAKRCGVSDIVERLRNWRSVHLARLHLLMEEAADEMDRLRLTDAERDALAAMVNRLCCEMTVVERDAMVGLLERLG